VNTSTQWTQLFLAAVLATYIGAFVVILVFVRRSTGANPFGQAEGQGLAKLSGGLATFLFLVTTIAYIFDARSVDWFGRVAGLDVPVAIGLGVVACLLAGVLLLWGEASLGRSFRVVLPDRKQSLVTHGIYRWMRNPLALSVDLFALGVFLLAPSWLALGSLILNVVAYEIKIRVEEAYLRQTHGAAYAAYCAQAGRYLPRLLRLDSEER
jgi:protein-S-isoprenylcysteine O-methyltransferase Ste14